MLPTIKRKMKIYSKRKRAFRQAKGKFDRRAASFHCSLVRRFVVFVISVFWSFVVLSFRRSLCRCFCRFVVRRVVLVSFVGILGPTGSHRRANGSFWMPFLTKGDARQDGKPSNKSKK
jgi:hypothetical protein